MKNRLGIGVLAALIFLLSACNTITGGFAVKPENAVQEFVKSVAFDRETDALSFTIPKGLASEHSFYIHVSGRIKMGDNGMSFHLFEEENESNNWEPGKTYRHEFEKDSLIEAVIVVGIQEQSKSELLHETQINVDADGNISISGGVSGVSESEPENAAPVAGMISITFPVSDKEKTEFNAHIYEIEPFDLSLELPEGWTVKERETIRGFDLDIVLAGAWSVVDIYNANGECVGAIGYNIYELYEGAEDDPRAIYGQIALGNGYRFDVRDSYNVVNETEYGTTAVLDVYYAANINNGVEKHNKGIVSYNKDFLVYIAMEFANDRITDEQLTDIAKSIRILRDNSLTKAEEIPLLTVTVEGKSVLLVDMDDPLVRNFFSGCDGYDVDSLDIVVESMETRQKTPGHIDPRYTSPIYSLDTDGHDAGYYTKLAEKLLNGEKMAGHVVQGMLSSPQWQGILFDDAGLPISIAIWGDDMQGNTAPVIDEMNRYEESERIDAFVRYFGGYILIMDDEIRNQLENHGFDLSKTTVKAGWFGYPGFFFTDGNTELIRVTGDTKMGYYTAGAYITPRELAEDAIKFAADEKVRREAEPPLAPGENPPTG